MRTKNDWSHDLVERLIKELNWSKRPLGDKVTVSVIDFKEVVI